MADRPDISRSADLLVALAGHARAALRFAVDGLSDDEYHWRPGAPEVMTIGWRVAHVVAVLECYTANTFDGAQVPFASIVPPEGPGDALDRLHAAQDVFVRHVATIDSASLATPTRAHWGDELPLWQLVWTPIVEQFHHGAEIGALRDVKRGAPRTEWWPELQGADWWPDDLR